MKVFMLGWEFPPYISGGLGTACYGLTRGLDEIGVNVSFVLPRAVPLDDGQHVQLRTPSNLSPQQTEEYEVEDQITDVFENLHIHRLSANFQAYATPETYEKEVRELLSKKRSIRRRYMQLLGSEHPDETTRPESQGMFVPGAGADYHGDLMAQVHRYAALARLLSGMESFDVIHAHDWMTYPAGIAVTNATGKPLVVHVHSTEFDRSGQHINQQIYDIERAGMHRAAKVVCVSHLTRNIVVTRYGVAPEKTVVVYNAVDLPENGNTYTRPIRQDEKIVLFLGRITMQKGPEYFLQAAQKVIGKYPKVRFVMAGSGDMITRCIRMAADLKIGGNVTFTGFLRGNDVARIMQMADLYVMPSVSEPFGIAPLEALSHNVPVIISKQSGVSEVLTHALKVDFWDIDEMANKILAVLRHPPLQKTLRQHGQFELKKLSWRDSAEKLNDVYEQAVESSQQTS